MAAQMQILNQRLSDLLVDHVDLYSQSGSTFEPVDRDNYINSANRLFYKAFCDSYRLIIRKNRGATHIDIQAGLDLLRDFVVPANVDVQALSGFQDGGSGGGVKLSQLTNGDRLKELLYVMGDIGGIKRNYRVVTAQEMQLAQLDLPKYRPSTYNRLCWLTQDSTPEAVIRMEPSPDTTTKVQVTYLTFPKDNLTSDGTDDIQWSSQYYDDLLQIAKAFSFRDDGDDQAFQSLVATVLQNYAIAPEVIKSSVMIEEQIKAQP